MRFIRNLEQGKATVRLDNVQAVLDVLGLELTSIREAHVFKGDRLAAMLRRLPGGVEFAYLPE